jgi:hypothetical protein
MIRKKTKQALLFMNKKKQKNFIYSGAGALAAGSPNGTVQRRKSFLVLFFKKACSGRRSGEPLFLNLIAS